MLHILDGESSAGTLAHSEVPGEKFAWREALIDGPSPAGVEDDEWLNLRARHLAGNYELEFQQCLHHLQQQRAMLQTLGDHDEVILWFEHDLFCQSNLLYLLNWCAQNQVASKTKLSLICIDRFPGIEDFRGLGQLDPEQLASLFPLRHAVTQAELDTATTAWAAYRAPQPTTLTALIKTDLSSLPFLKRALELHLARFPATTNGLGLIENTALQLIADGLTSFGELFRRFVELQPVYGLGDLQLWEALRRLTQCPEPLLKLGADASADRSQEAVRATRYELTVFGENVLRKTADFVRQNGIDQWLGGVHLQGRENVWRWDEQTKMIARML